MGMKDKSIRIQDWAGNILFVGDYDDERVDAVLAANKCPICDGGYLYDSKLEEDMDCDNCNATGYWGDFEVSWIDEQNDADGMNVYEYINY